MLITRKSQLSGIERTIDLPITQAELDRNTNGELAQRVWPHLSGGDREFIISGITNEEWDKAFPPEGEDEESKGRYKELLAWLCGNEFELDVNPLQD